MWSLGLRPLPISLLSATVLSEVAAVSLSWGLEPSYDTGLYAVFGFAMAGAGALVASRHPKNPIGWLFCWFALLNALASDVAQGWGLRAAQQGWPGSEIGVLFSTASWMPSGLGWVLTFLLFPTGRLRSRRWRAVVATAAVGTVLAVPGWCLSPSRDPEFASGHNPIGTQAALAQALLVVGMTMFLTSFAASVVSLVLRYRRSSGEQRQQLKWFAYAASVAGVVLPLSAVLWTVTPLVQLLAAVALTALPVAACIAILRYRLYDIDLVVNRTIVYALVTGLLAATYTTVVLVLSLAVDRGSPVVAAVATLVVALVFQPFRRRVQGAVDRRFNRAAYDGVRRVERFLEALRAGDSAPEDIQQLLREVTDEPGLEIVFLSPDGGRDVNIDGEPHDHGIVGTLTPILVDREGHDLAVILTDTASPTLLRDVVRAAGLGIEIARLSIALRRQLAEVEASRGRIIEAGNAERRRIERDLHDGAQQRLVSIGLALRHAQHELSAARPDAVRTTLEEGVAEIALAIAELRELAQGLPPSQLDEGVGPALRELARRTPMQVEVEACVDRFGVELEAAAYFIGCEGLTNAVKHAGAQRVVMSAQRVGDQLVVSVTDDGVGGAWPGAGSGLRGLSDRVSALGGSLRIHSPAGAGTTVRAELPCGS